MLKDRSYIGKVEAFEIMLERKIDKLPRKGKEVWTVHAIAENKPIEVLGKDENGFYVLEIDQRADLSK